MIKDLKIQNLILIESATIPFCQGFNVLSGETGSGKSAIMEGIKAILGFRGDSGLIRKGSEKAVVEAAIDLKNSVEMLNLLNEAGIEHDETENLIIRREIAANGKSRAFVNQQMVQTSFLKKLGEKLTSIVGQHANQDLFELDQHCFILDTFAGLLELRSAFAKSFQNEQNLLKKILELQANEAERMRELESCQREIEELEEANLKEGEEEELFAEYQLLASVEERLQKSSEVYQTLSGEKSPLSLLKKQKIHLEQLARHDDKTKSYLNSFNEALLELEEIANELRIYLSRLEADPDRFQFISDRLAQISKLKKKYGSNFQEITAYLNKRKKDKSFLENADGFIEELKLELNSIQTKNRKLLDELTKKRTEAAKILEVAVTDEIQLLNMPKAEFSIRIKPEKPTSRGQDEVEFFLKPNIGEDLVSLKECASGGELSRVLLAIKTLLAGRESKLSIVFDEVDANVGGATASILGEKLKKLGTSYQVICITHFPQVAKHADHHLQISKIEKDGRTLTQVLVLDQKSRKDELLRMQGM